MEVRPALFEQIISGDFAYSTFGWMEGKRYLKSKCQSEGLVNLIMMASLLHCRPWARLATTSPVNYKRLSFVQEMTSSLQIATRMLSFRNSRLVL
jgi:hypothetical protein